MWIRPLHWESPTAAAASSTSQAFVVPISMLQASFRHFIDNVFFPRSRESAPFPSSKWNPDYQLFGPPVPRACPLRSALCFKSFLYLKYLRCLESSCHHEVPSDILISDALEPGLPTMPSTEVRSYYLNPSGFSLIHLPGFRAIDVYTFWDDIVNRIFSFVGCFPVPKHRIRCPITVFPCFISVWNRITRVHTHNKKTLQS